MPSRIYGRNPHFEAMKKIRDSTQMKWLRKMLKKSVKWHNVRVEKRQISELCARLQLPPERLPEFFQGKKAASEVIEELRSVVEAADHARIAPMQAKEIFRKAHNIGQAKAYIAQMAQAAA